MVTFPNCKINLGLNILEKRNDGFHNLETVFYPINITDALEIIQSKHHATEIQFTTSGLIVDGKTTDNICVKAYHLLRSDFPQIACIKMHLHKAIPLGAGLGGGSANGAFTLKMLNNIFQLNISDEKLMDYALQLGSDCPFFIINKPCFAKGRGEKMEIIKLDLSQYQFVIVNPKIYVNTGWAFKQIIPKIPKKSIQKIIPQPIETWKDELVNDFENAVINEHKEIGEIKYELYQQGALYASMSGSGSTVFGIFNKETLVKNNFPNHYFFKQM